MKKVLTMFLILAIAVSSAACSFSEIEKDIGELINDTPTGTSDSATQEPSDVTTEENTKEENKTEEANTEEDNTEATKQQVPQAGEFTIEETVLLDEKDVKITATGIQYDELYKKYLLSLLIENNSDKTLRFSLDKCAINGYMVSSPYVYATVSSGKKSNETMDISKSELDFLGIDTIADFKLSFSISTDDYETYIEPSLIQLNTSAAETYVYNYDDSGEVVYDDNNIKIVVKSLLEDYDDTYTSVLVYIENNNDFDINISAEDVSVNGFMIDPYFYEDIFANTHCVTTIDFYNSDLSDNNISSIDSVSLIFYAIDENWDTVAESDEIDINF